MKRAHRVAAAKRREGSQLERTACMDEGDLRRDTLTQLRQARGHLGHGVIGHRQKYHYRLRRRKAANQGRESLSSADQTNLVTGCAQATGQAAAEVAPARDDQPRRSV